MGFSAALRSSLPPNHSPELFSLRFSFKLNRVAFTSTKKSRSSVQIVKSVLNGSSSSISDNGATEPARILLERLFAQKHKLEQQISRDSHFARDVESGFNLGVLESDLLAVLQALKKKEADLQDAEKQVLSEHSDLHRTKEELERQGKQISVAYSKHEKLETELRKANFNLVSQARRIEDLKLKVKEREEDMIAAQSALSGKEAEMEKMRIELMKRREESAKVVTELKTKAQLLDEANEVVNKQAIELRELKNAIREKEQELEDSCTHRKLEEEKLKVAEAKLEKQAMEWLIAQGELKKISDKASKQIVETKETVHDFRKVKKLLIAVRTELVSSQKSLASSRNRMEEQDKQLKKQLGELEEERKSVMTYMTNLKDAQAVVESERLKLRVVEARNKELERDLSMEKELMEELHEELKKEKSSLEQTMQEKYLLQQELEQKNAEFEEIGSLISAKESELVDAKLEIQHLKSEQASLHCLLEEKDRQLLIAEEKLKNVDQEVAELKMLLISKEDQLIQTTKLLKEKEEHVQIIEDELDGTRMKQLEAENVVEQIAELTNKLVISINDDDYKALMQPDMELMQQHFPRDDSRLQIQQLENELSMTRESLRMKEKEVLASKRALTVKDEELKAVLGRLDTKEKELKRLKDEMVEDANDLKKLYALAQERIGSKSIGDFAIEKLQLEAAQLEVEAATGALHKIVEMSRQLLSKASLDAEMDSDIGMIVQNGRDLGINLFENNECLKEVKVGVAKLSALSEQLVKAAGVTLGRDLYCIETETEKENSLQNVAPK
ncbi:MAR-binding filament-like protein 1 [Euphorbia lathyris]|uniref:MAR-binding filament-like protein 1 n=1 Tax=Euphorbia lathyris TaxID=212925 RepID=UPI0033133C6B